VPLLLRLLQPVISTRLCLCSLLSLLGIFYLTIIEFYFIITPKSWDVDLSDAQSIKNCWQFYMHVGRASPAYLRTTPKLCTVRISAHTQRKVEATPKSVFPNIESTQLPSQPPPPPPPSRSSPPFFDTPSPRPGDGGYKPPFLSLQLSSFCLKHLNDFGIIRNDHCSQETTSVACKNDIPWSSR